MESLLEKERIWNESVRERGKGEIFFFYMTWPQAKKLSENAWERQRQKDNNVVYLVVTHMDMYEFLMYLAEP